MTLRCAVERLLDLRQSFAGVARFASVLEPQKAPKLRDSHQPHHSVLSLHRYQINHANQLIEINTVKSNLANQPIYVNQYSRVEFVKSSLPSQPQLHAPHPSPTELRSREREPHEFISSGKHLSQSSSRSPKLPLQVARLPKAQVPGPKNSGTEPVSPKVKVGVQLRTGGDWEGGKAGGKPAARLARTGCWGPWGQSARPEWGCASGEHRPPGAWSDSPFSTFFLLQPTTAANFRYTIITNHTGVSSSSPHHTPQPPGAHQTLRKPRQGSAAWRLLSMTCKYCTWLSLAPSPML